MRRFVPNIFKNKKTKLGSMCYTVTILYQFMSRIFGQKYHNICLRQAAMHQIQILSGIVEQQTLNYVNLFSAYKWLTWSTSALIEKSNRESEETRISKNMFDSVSPPKWSICSTTVLWWFYNKIVLSCDVCWHLFVIVKSFVVSIARQVLPGNLLSNGFRQTF